jgi:hypothetical protein
MGTIRPLAQLVRALKFLVSLIPRVFILVCGAEYGYFAYW